MALFWRGIAVSSAHYCSWYERKNEVVGAMQLLEKIICNIVKGKQKPNQ